MAATGNQEQSIELPDVAGDDHQETSEAEKVNLVSATSGVEKNEGTDTAEREKPATSGPESGEVGRTAEVQEAAVPEKLQDDDQLKEIWYKRLLFKVFPKLMRVEERRILRANDDVYNWQFRYVANKVVTSKYNIITFVPLNLIEQFFRVANAYFLLLVILQAIPTLSSVNVFSTAFPLIGVLLVTAIKDAADDIKRHISDWKINHRVAHVLNPAEETLEDRSWQSVRVGSILRLNKDDFVTADMLLLSSSEPNSLVYIETAELDGETNLKVREPVQETAELEDDLEKLSQFRGEVKCEPPNNRLHKFVGTLTIRDEEQPEATVTQYSLDNDKILLRGCRLRNTKWMYGLVIYAGHDTKLVQNSGRTKFKRTHLDLLMNQLVLMILGFLLACLTVCLIGSLIYEFVYGQPFTIYAAYYNSAQDHPAELAFLQIFSNLIVLNTFVPISLYVSVEVIRLGQSLLINWDRKMYYEPEDVPAIARTTTLNEELGQIEYIFSDKTGTLTQNVMTFHKCTIGGVKYGDVTPDVKDKEQVVATGEENLVQKQVSQENTQSSPKLQPIDLTEWNQYADPDFVFYDGKMVEKCRSGDPACNEFFTLLSLCHTVLPSMETGTLQYNAQSPDEAALVSAAKNFGYVFKARSPFAMTVDMLNKSNDSEQNIEVLNILDFNNERKRMSVIVRIDEKIILYCKGADSIVFARLNKESEPLMKTTLVHLADYAREGLRTLVLAKKELTVEEYTAFAEEYHEASIQQENRDQAVDQVYEKIEQNLTLMGATAIEDKLQDGVPETIANLAKANIKIWVLTGDKQETAVNIGYSCKLLTEDMRVFIVDEDTSEGVQQQLQEYGEAMDKCEQRKVADGEGNGELLDENNQDDGYIIDESKLGPPFGIVINGHSLRHALKEDVKLQLLETASRCKAVICCRVTPLQKKRVVDLVKKNKDAVTLAIGDGANDVGMIKAAHIGVGISGREGRQAVLASDYSFGQFRYLERLLLVHGRWSYHRMTAFLRYFFYKNFAFAFSQFIFAFFCGFTAQTLYDPTFITVYNVIYTSLPVVALAILDQDVDENNCYRYPRLYFAGQQNKNFNPFIFARSLMKGVYVAFILFFVLFGMTFLNYYSEGYEWDYQSVGLAASGALVLIVNLQIALDTFHWNPIMHIFIWGSILSWLVVIPITSVPGLYGLLNFFEYLGAAYEVLATGTFWIYLPIATVIALLPTIIFRMVRVDVDPHIVDDVRLVQKKEGRRLFKRPKFHFKPVDSAVTRRSVKRTGYAYSHTEGFGDMISSGRIFGMNEEQVADERRRRLSTIILSSRPTSPPSSSVKAMLAASAAGVVSAIATHGILQEEKPEIIVEIHVVEREDAQTESQSNQEKETKPQDEPSPMQVDDFTSAEGDRGELSVPADDVTSDNDSSTALLLPTKIDSSGDEEEGKTNLIEVKGDTDEPPVSINLPGSVESPSHDHDKEEGSVRDDGANDDQKLLIPSEREQDQV